jgi:hypothetical protein
MLHGRKKVSAALGLVVALMAGLAWAIPATPGASGYHVLKTIPISGTEGWDYVTMDSAARLLYIGRGNHIDVVNVDSGTVVAR